MASSDESNSCQSSGDQILDDPVPKKRQYKDLVQKLQNFRVQTEFDRMLLKGVFESYSHAFRGSYVTRWAWMGGIIAILLGLIIIFQKAKDTI